MCPSKSFGRAPAWATSHNKGTLMGRNAPDQALIATVQLTRLTQCETITLGNDGQEFGWQRDSRHLFFVSHGSLLRRWSHFEKKCSIPQHSLATTSVLIFQRSRSLMSPVRYTLAS